MSKRNNPEHKTKGQRKYEMARKREERAVRQAHKKEKAAKSYLADDENFTSFANQLKMLKLQLRDITGDGNCLFRALADQLEGHGKHHLKYRQEVCKYMEEHRDDFEPFVEDDVPFSRHLSQLRKPGTYAGNDAIVAFARLHNLHVNIHQFNSPIWEIHGTDDPNALSIHISYHNGDHYSSVRRLGDSSETPANVNLKEAAATASEKKKPKGSKSHVGNEWTQADWGEYNDIGSIDQPDFGETEEGLARAYQDLEDIENQLMVETGCTDRLLVRKALDMSNLNVDEAVILILQMLSDNHDNFHSFDMPGANEYSPADGCARVASAALWEDGGTADRLFGGFESEPSGAIPKKQSKRNARAEREQKKLDKKKRASERHKQRLLGEPNSVEYHSHSPPPLQDEEDVILVQHMNTLKI